MEITYLGHSGFLVETSAAYYLFDYIRGNLPAFESTKRLYVFVSHAHQDHWNTGIFTDVRLKNAHCFILGFDIQEPFEAMTHEDPSLAELPVLLAHPQQTIKTEDFSCLPLLSTDEGVAFLQDEGNSHRCGLYPSGSQAGRCVPLLHGLLHGDTGCGACLSDAFLGRPRTWQNIPCFSEISASGPGRKISPDPLRGRDILPVIMI